MRNCSYQITLSVNLNELFCPEKHLSPTNAFEYKKVGGNVGQNNRAERNCGFEETAGVVMSGISLVFFCVKTKVMLSLELPEYNTSSSHR